MKLKFKLMPLKSFWEFKMKKIFLVLLTLVSLSACDFARERIVGGQVIAYPSPSRVGYVNFARIPVPATITIYTRYGDVVDKFNATEDPARWTYSNVASGVYIAIIEGGGKRYSVKFALIN